MRLRHPASFLRLASVPQALTRDGEELGLIEVRIVERTVVGAITPASARPASSISPIRDR